MKLILQRVSSASVFVDGVEVSSIKKGILVLFCAEKGDSEGQADFLAEKTLNLRMNKLRAEKAAEILSSELCPVLHELCSVQTFRINY